MPRLGRLFANRLDRRRGLRGCSLWGAAPHTSEAGLRGAHHASRGGAVQTHEGMQRLGGVRAVAMGDEREVCVNEVDCRVNDGIGPIPTRRLGSRVQAVGLQAQCILSNVCVT